MRQIDFAFLPGALMLLVALTPPAVLFADTFMSQSRTGEHQYRHSTCSDHIFTDLQDCVTGL